MEPELKIKNTSIEEGLGNAVSRENFKILKIEGNTVSTDYYPEKFDIRTTPFDYREGDIFHRDVWENGDFWTQERTGQTYFLYNGGKPIKIESDVDEFIEFIQHQGTKNKFERLLREDKITARVRTRNYDGQSGILETALAENWFAGEPESPFYEVEAYCILTDFENVTGRIVEAKYDAGGSLFEKANYKLANVLKLPDDIIRYGIRADTGIKFKPISKESMLLIRNNSYRPPTSS